jgi:holliday junction DNA helicase RuvA
VIALLRGRVAGLGPGSAVLDVGGVGYRVHVPPGGVPGTLGDEIVLHTHLAVREDALTLYGFAETSARDLFEVLLGVSGVGPKVALAALGTLGADSLRRAVLAEDVAALTVIPGVGRKGAQRMILELRGKLGAPGMADADGLPGGVPNAGAPGPRAEVRAALGALGYAAAEVQAALDALPPDADTQPPEDLLRSALRSLGTR